MICLSRELGGVYEGQDEERVAHIAGLGPQIASFQTVCRVMDLILIAKRCEADVQHASVELQKALEAHMQLHQHASVSYTLPTLPTLYPVLFSCSVVPPQAQSAH